MTSNKPVLDIIQVNLDKANFRRPGINFERLRVREIQSLRKSRNVCSDHFV